MAAHGLLRLCFVLLHARFAARLALIHRVCALLLAPVGDGGAVEANARALSLCGVLLREIAAPPQLWNCARACVCERGGEGKGTHE